MERTLNAIYENGHLRLLDPVTLREGEQVHIRIVSERELVRAALADILVPRDPAAALDDGFDDDALQAEIDAAHLEGLNLSEAIIQERYED